MKYFYPMKNKPYKILTGHQPDFLPWLGFFYKASNCDILRVADHVSYSTNWTNRVKIKSPRGEILWLTVPVERSRTGTRIADVKIKEVDKNLKSIVEKIRFCYYRADYFKDLLGISDLIGGYSGENLSNFNMSLIGFCLEQLHIDTEIVFGTKLNLRNGKTEHIVDSCLKLDSSIYVAGQGADYLNEDLFNKNRIKLIRSRFVHPVYRQVGDGFMPGLSIIDAVANMGWEQLRIELSGQKLDI